MGMAYKNKHSAEHQNLSIYMCLGMSVGTAIGVALKNISLWMSIGMMIGICIGAAIDYENQKKSEKKNDDEKME